MYSKTSLNRPSKKTKNGHNTYYSVKLKICHKKSSLDEGWSTQRGGLLEGLHCIYFSAFFPAFFFFFLSSIPLTIWSHYPVYSLDVLLEFYNNNESYHLIYSTRFTRWIKPPIHTGAGNNFLMGSGGKVMPNTGGTLYVFYSLIINQQPDFPICYIKNSKKLGRKISFLIQQLVQLFFWSRLKQKMKLIQRVTSTKQM